MYNMQYYIKLRVAQHLFVENQILIQSLKPLKPFIASEYAIRGVVVSPSL